MLGIIVAFVALKGGAGKSALAIACAVEWHRRGYRVGVIDADLQQRTVIEWDDDRAEYGKVDKRLVVKQLGSNVDVEAADMRRHFDIIIVDTPARIGGTAAEALSICQLALIPCTPGVSSVNSTGKTEDQVLKVKAKANRNMIVRVVICQKVVNTVAGRTARRAFDDYAFEPLDTELDASQEYDHAQKVGDAPTTYAPTSKAAAQVYALVSEVDRLLGLPARPKKEVRSYAVA